MQCRQKQAATCIVIGILTPLVLGAVSVAAGHVLWSRIDDPALVAAYGNYRIDRLILFANAVVCVGIVALVVWRLPFRRRFATILAGAAALASLPAYVLAYLYSFEIAQWLGLGWSASA